MYNNRKSHHVYYKEPKSIECKNLIWESNLKNINPKDTVFVGYGLDNLSKGKWLGEGTFLYKAFDFH